jgi:HEAT repeat protein
MPKKKLEQALAALEELRQGGDPAVTIEALRKALLNRNNYLVAKAARVAAELGARQLVPDLVGAFDRFFSDPVDSDPQCWAKIALAKALAELGHDHPATFIRGLRHMQREPVWGGREDTAGPLRAACALAILACRQLSDVEALKCLIDVAFDADKTVRIEAVRAIGRIGLPEAALLLRMRALAGDSEPEVLGSCYSALLSIEGRHGLEFVERFLEGEGDAASEAALAIGALRTPDAYAFVRKRWERGAAEPLASVLLAAIALTRQEEAVVYLLRLIETDSQGAGSAIQALAKSGFPDAVRSQVAAAVEASGSGQLQRTFRQHFAA